MKAPSCTLNLASFLRSGAILSLPSDDLLIAWGHKRSFSSKELDLNQPAFFVPDFFLEAPSPWMVYENTLVTHKADFLNALASVPSKRCSVEWKIGQEDFFVRSLADLQVLFQEGSLQKAVPYLFASSASFMSKPHLAFSLAAALRSQQKGQSWVYGYWGEEEGVLGLTPETLFSILSFDPPVLETMALAGTARHADGLDDFLSDEKERLEHAIVVNYIEEALKPFGRVLKKEQKLLSFQQLTHFKTPIEVNLFADVSFESLVLALHPTPALGAFPPETGRKWLKGFDEQQPRGSFGAPFGFRWPEKKIATCLVAIRNVSWNRQGLRIGAGCGVLSTSVPSKELVEIRLKMKATQDALGL